MTLMMRFSPGTVSRAIVPGSLRAVGASLMLTSARNLVMGVHAVSGIGFSSQANNAALGFAMLTGNVAAKLEVLCAVQMSSAASETAVITVHAVGVEGAVGACFLDEPILTREERPGHL